MKIQIHSYEFEVQDPYSVGHVLSSDEANALNVLRRERIRNATYKFLIELERRYGTKILPVDQELRVREKVKGLDASFRFTSKPGASPVLEKVGTLEAELRALCRARAESELRSIGVEIEEDLVQARMSELAEWPSLQEEAKRRFEIHRSSGQSALESLL